MHFVSELHSDEPCADLTPGKPLRILSGNHAKGEIEAAMAAAVIFNNLFMINLEEVGVSRFLPARFHAHFIFRLACRAGIVFHAGSLLVAAYFAACLLRLCCIIGPIKTSEYQQRYRKDSHDKISSRC
jgi:hypothetical protein